MEDIESYNLRRIQSLEYEVNNNPELPRNRLVRICITIGQLREHERIRNFLRKKHKQHPCSYDMHDLATDLQEFEVGL